MIKEKNMPPQDERKADAYIEGLRDLAVMPHVLPEIGHVLRDCADLLEKCNAEINRLSSAPK